MTAADVDTAALSPLLLRFDIVTRVVHWVTAALMGVLLATGTILYVGQLEAMIGRRALLKEIHVASGLLLVVPVLAGVLLRRAGRRLRTDLVDLGRWSRADQRWIRKRTRTVPAGKFNGGQKLASVLFAGLSAMLLLTGSVMYWNKPFADEWRTGATFVHDWAYLGMLVLVIGHIRKALSEPELMRSMRTGTVRKAWADRERPGWSAGRSGDAGRTADQAGHDGAGDPGQRT